MGLADSAEDDVFGGPPQRKRSPLRLVENGEGAGPNGFASLPTGLQHKALTPISPSEAEGDQWVDTDTDMEEDNELFG
jgi:hypothetical protein